MADTEVTRADDFETSWAECSLSRIRMRAAYKDVARRGWKWGRQSTANKIAQKLRERALCCAIFEPEVPEDANDKLASEVLEELVAEIEREYGVTP